MKKREIKIYVERERVIEISMRNRSVEAWCKQCGKRVRMLRAEEAAHTTGVSQRLINRWVEEGRLHFFETADGLLLICLDSLADLSSPE